MKRAVYIQREVEQVGTIESLTGVFESIASIHIAQIKDKVLSSTAFFDELWRLYTQLRIDEKHRKKRRAHKTNGRTALVAITSEGGLIGDIDERIIAAMLQHPDRDKTDIYTIGSHGAALLARHGIKPVKAFALPESDTDMPLGPIMAELDAYTQSTVYYQTYISLLRQEIAKINLVSAVEALSQNATLDENRETITPEGYIFEPSLDEVTDYMETVMRSIALGQVILESKLAQYASRFNTMSSAKHKAGDMKNELKLQYNRSKRAQGDERIKETVNSMRALRG